MVRIRNGEVCYWPNLGYGRFGSKIAMDDAPWFERQDLFDGRRIHLADVDGSGTTDIIYAGSGGAQIYFNQSGNRWGAKRALDHFPAVESISTVAALDLLGNGTACLVWSSPLPGNTQRQMRYIDLMGGQKPHLLVRTTNNLGAETLIQHAPSTKFYVADRLAGTPWVTRLPFPVHVVEQVQWYDHVSRNLFTSRYSYHHGYFDGVEREFRGFGRVDQRDTESLAALSESDAFPAAENLDAASSVPPVLTKTWFHTGAFFEADKISKYFAHEYYVDGNASLLPDTVLPGEVFLPDGTHQSYDLSGSEMRQACRALHGSVLRQEIYAEDGTDASSRPYSVSERNYSIEVLQPEGPNPFGVFFAHARETIDSVYERKLYANSTEMVADPRVTHSVVIAVDNFGNVLKSATIAYGRRNPDTSLAPADQSQQSAVHGVFAQQSYTNKISLDHKYSTPLPAEASSYEILQLPLTHLFSFDEIQAAVRSASDGAHDLAFESLHPTALNAGQPYRRLLNRARIYYRSDDLTATLPLGSLESHGLPAQSYTLAFTSGLIAQVYRRDGNPLLTSPATLLTSTQPDGGGYVDLDGDGNFWAPSGRSFFAPDEVSPSDELAQANQHFFLPRRFVDPFGHAGTVSYDAHDLLSVSSTDALGNATSVSNDYRVLAPSIMTDPNGNQTKVGFDTLGMVAGTGVMGKTNENLGDPLETFVADLEPSQIAAFFSGHRSPFDRSHVAGRCDHSNHLRLRRISAFGISRSCGNDRSRNSRQ